MSSDLQNFIIRCCLCFFCGIGLRKRKCRGRFYLKLLNKEKAFSIRQIYWMSPALTYSSDRLLYNHTWSFRKRRYRPEKDCVGYHHYISKRYSRASRVLVDDWNAFAMRNSTKSSSRLWSVSNNVKAKLHSKTTLGQSYLSWSLNLLMRKLS